MNYEKLNNKYKKQYNLNCLIGLVLIIVGIIFIKVRFITTILLTVMGVCMLTVTKKNYEKRKLEIGKIKDPSSFDKSMKNSLMNMPEFSLYLCDQYVVSELHGLNIFVLKDMKKFEVGIAGDKKKTLFLTDKENNRWEIATTLKGDKRQASFDEVYYKVKDIFDNKKYR